MQLSYGDKLSWWVIRFIYLIVWFAYCKYYEIRPPEKLGDKVESMSHIYGAWHIYETPLQELPEIVRDQLLLAGRLCLVVILFVTIFTILGKVF